MNKKNFSKRTSRLLGLAAFVATGGGLIISTAIHEENFYKTEILITIGCFYAMSLLDHYKKLISGDDLNENK